MLSIFKTKNKKEKIQCEVTSITNGTEVKMESDQIFFQDNDKNEIIIGLNLKTGQQLVLRFNK